MFCHNKTYDYHNRSSSSMDNRKVAPKNEDDTEQDRLNIYLLLPIKCARKFSWDI